MIYAHNQKCKIWAHVTHTIPKNMWKFSLCGMCAASYLLHQYTITLARAKYSKPTSILQNNSLKKVSSWHFNLVCVIVNLVSICKTDKKSMAQLQKQCNTGRTYTNSRHIYSECSWACRCSVGTNKLVMTKKHPYVIHKTRQHNKHTLHDIQTFWCNFTTELNYSSYNINVSNLWN